MATVSFMENIQEWVVGGGRPLGTYNPEGGLTIVTTPEPNSGLMFGVCFLLGAIVLRGKFVSHIELSPTLSTRLCTDSAVGCEDHQLQLALPAPHVASRLIIAGVDIRTVLELLDHKTSAVTMRYAHLAPKHTLGCRRAFGCSHRTLH